MEIKEIWGVNVGLALGHLIYPFRIIRFVELTLILGKITGEKLI